MTLRLTLRVGRRLAMGIASITMAAQGGMCLADEKPVIDIGRQRELFLDDHLIDKLDGAQLVLHPPVPQEIAINHDEPWEGSTCAYHTVFKDGELYRLYYRGGWGYHIYCYAESRDGVHWVKPKLGLFEFKGSKDNNIILMGEGTESFAPFKDANPNSAPDAPYKAFAVHCKNDPPGSLGAFKSVDGIRWARMGDKPLITKGHFDSQNLAFWDTVRQRYVEFHRWYQIYPGSDMEVRDIMTSTSTDFLNWTEPPVTLEYPGSPPEDLYTSQIVAYHRAPHLFLGFPKRLLPFRWIPGNKMEGLSDGVFMSSRDGRVFKRWTEAFIRPGQNRERWFNRNNMTAWGIVETAGSIPGCPRELSLYSTEGYYETMSVKLRRFTMRLDGFVSVNAPMRGGELLTKPLVFAAPEKSQPEPVRPADPIVRTEEKPIIGKAALVFKEPAVLPIPSAQELGSQVTFAVHVRGISAMTGRRFFAAYDGGQLKEGDRKLVFDAAVYSVPDGPAIRFIYSGMETVVPRSKVGGSLWDKKVHHLAATWDDGEVTIYVDGRKVGTGGRKGAGALSMADKLRFGEGYPGPLHFERPFAGDHHDAMVDDILVLRRVLSEEEIARMAKDGALTAVDPGKDKGVLYSMEEDPNVGRRVRDHLSADGSSDTELPPGGIEWGEVQLLVNYSTSAAGSVRCELQDEQGHPLPGFSLADSDLIYGDDIERPFSWRGRTELKSLVGKPVKLRFELKDADLYAIRFGQKP
jgi:hypothetical protein|uniref:LamG domain-containing protein n=1 Tax=Prosthecobacter sp. TaxID=1965333 RepID=UPI003784550F